MYAYLYPTTSTTSSLSDACVCAPLCKRGSGEGGGGEDANGGAGGGSTGKKSTGGKSRTQGEAFKRVQDEQWVGGLKKGFDDNTYEVCMRHACCVAVGLLLGGADGAVRLAALDRHVGLATLDERRKVGVCFVVSLHSIDHLVCCIDRAFCLSHENTKIRHQSHSEVHLHHVKFVNRLRIRAGHVWARRVRVQGQREAFEGAREGLPTREDQEKARQLPGRRDLDEQLLRQVRRQRRLITAVTLLVLLVIAVDDAVGGACVAMVNRAGQEGTVTSTAACSH